MERTIKVLAITNVYPSKTTPGAPAIKDQLNVLKQYGVQVDLLRIDREYKINYFKALWRVFLLNFKPKKYQLIHAFYGHCGLIARFQVKYPILVTYLGSDLLSSKDGTIGKIVAKLVDGLIVMTNEMKQVSGRNDARVIPFGVNTDIFQPYDYAQSREELGLEKNKKYILFPYNPNRKEKRFDIILDTVQILRDRGYDVEIVIAKNETHSMIARYMSAADGLILASDHEGSPLAIREALACHLPIVAVPVGDVKDLIGNMNQCYIVEKKATNIADAFEKIIQSKKRIDNCNSSYIDINYSAKQVYGLYHSIIGYQN